MSTRSGPSRGILCLMSNYKRAALGPRPVAALNLWPTPPPAHVLVTSRQHSLHRKKAVSHSYPCFSARSMQQGGSPESAAHDGESDLPSSRASQAHDQQGHSTTELGCPTCAAAAARAAADAKTIADLQSQLHWLTAKASSAGERIHGHFSSLLVWLTVIRDS